MSLSPIVPFFGELTFLEKYKRIHRFKTVPINCIFIFMHTYPGHTEYDGHGEVNKNTYNFN